MNNEVRPPNPGLTVAVFGATGNLGGHYAQQALAAGHTLRALARTVTKLTIASHPDVTAIQGDATSPEDVARGIDGADVVVSCVGNPNKHTQIMQATANNILDAAAQRPEPPRCIFISSIGCGGTSRLIGKVLERIGGKPSWADYQAADLRIRSEHQVPGTLVRPYALTDKPGKGTYNATTKTLINFARPIARTDVARFLLDATSDPQWDGPTASNSPAPDPPTNDGTRSILRRASSGAALVSAQVHTGSGR